MEKRWRNHKHLVPIRGWRNGELTTQQHSLEEVIIHTARITNPKPLGAMRSVPETMSPTLTSRINSRTWIL